MMKNDETESELILTSGGRVYHLHLVNEEIADDVILVGDPGRVERVSRLFDVIETTSVHREFISHTGRKSGRRITVLSTGIGTDNIDIVLNELDAAVNIDPVSRKRKSRLRRLNLFRLGTCGGIQGDINIEDLVVSSHAIGMDCLMNFYRVAGQDDAALSGTFTRHMNWPQHLHLPISFSADNELLTHFCGQGGYCEGITVTAPGFYGPQGRIVRLETVFGDLNERLSTFNHAGRRILNFEMETSALYGLSRLLGHRALTVCVVIANRFTGSFCKDPESAVDRAIRKVLHDICSNKT